MKTKRPHPLSTESKVIRGGDSMTARAITARTHDATRYFSSTWSQDRQRAIWASMTPRHQRLEHKRAEYQAACVEWTHAWDTPAEAHWLRLMDTLNAEIDELEDQERIALAALLEAA